LSNTRQHSADANAVALLDIAHPSVNTTGLAKRVNITAYLEGQLDLSARDNRRRIPRFGARDVQLNRCNSYRHDSLLRLFMSAASHDSHQEKATGHCNRVNRSPLHLSPPIDFVISLVRRP